MSRCSQLLPYVINFRLSLLLFSRLRILSASLVSAAASTTELPALAKGALCRGYQMSAQILRTDRWLDGEWALACT